MSIATTTVVVNGNLRHTASACCVIRWNRPPGIVAACSVMSNLRWVRSLAERPSGQVRSDDAACNNDLVVGAGAR